MAIMLPILDQLVEQRIVRAQTQGEFDGLPGAGRPLDLSEPPLVPEDVRIANRILKNAGLVPEPVMTLAAQALMIAATEPPPESGGSDRTPGDASADRRMAPPPESPGRSPARRTSIALVLQARGIRLDGQVRRRYVQAVVSRLAGS